MRCLVDPLWCGMKVLIGLALVTLVALVMGRFQHTMIYYPRPYPAGYPLVAEMVSLAFLTGEGSQTAYYLPARRDEGELPERLWLVFGGNASLALDWQDFATSYPDPQAAFLLIDYPGYGRSAGRATPDSILSVAESAIQALAGQLAVSPDLLTERVSLLGHSLGASAALLYGARHPVARLVLISPFTSLRDMAELLVGSFRSRFLIHDYDNRARLGELAAQDPRPRVFILHGDQDRIVPVAMGRELAALYPRMIHYLEIKGGDHNSIIGLEEERIIGAMLHL